MIHVSENAFMKHTIVYISIKENPGDKMSLFSHILVFFYFMKQSWRLIV